MIPFIHLVQPSFARRTRPRVGSGNAGQWGQSLVGSGDSPCVVASFASTRQECRVPFASQLRGVVGDSLSDATMASRLRGYAVVLPQMLQ